MYIVNNYEDLKSNVVLGVHPTCCVIGVQKIYASCFILKRDKAVDGEIYTDDNERGIAFFNLHIEEFADDKAVMEEKNETMPSFLQYYFLLESPFTKEILKSYGFKCTDPNVLMKLDEKKTKGLTKVIKQMKAYQDSKEKFQNLSFEMDNWGC